MSASLKASLRSRRRSVLSRGCWDMYFCRGKNTIFLRFLHYHLRMYSSGQLRFGQIVFGEAVRFPFMARQTM